MMRRRRTTTTARFTRGLVTDRVGARDALLEARDVVPMERGNAWRTRGGRGSGTNVTGATGYAGVVQATGLQMGAGTYYGLLSATTSGGYGLFPLGANSAGSQLPYGVNLPSGAAATFTGRTNNLLAERGIEFGQEAWGLCASRIPVRWAGVAGDTEYATGTVSGTMGQTTITGAGTTFTSAHVGRYLLIDDATSGMRAFRIIAFTSTTVLVLDRALPSTFAGKSFRISPVSWWSVAPGTFGAGDYVTPATHAAGAKNFLNARDVTQHLARPFVVDTIDADGLRYPERCRWGATEFETDALFGGDGEWGGAEYFHPNAFVDVAPGRGGAQLLAVRSLGSMVLFFKERAVFALRGFVETDGRDVGAVVEPITLEVGLTYGEPVVTEFGCFFMSRKGVYLITEQGQVVCVTDRDGVRNAYKEIGESSALAPPTTLSWTGRRLVIQNTETRADAVTNNRANTLIWDSNRGVWYQQQTNILGRIIDTTNNIAAGLGRALDTTAGKIVDFASDVFFNRSASSAAISDNDQGVEVLGELTTHAIPLGDKLNARVSAVLVKARVYDPDNINTVEVQVQVLPGEEGTNDAIENTLNLTERIAESANITEGWRRQPIRSGCPPVDSARVRLTQTAKTKDLRIYEVGVEHVAVDRVR